MYLPTENSISKRRLESLSNEADKTHLEAVKWEELARCIGQVGNSITWTLATFYQDLEDIDGKITIKFRKDVNGTIIIEANYDDEKDWINEDVSREIREDLVTGGCLKTELSNEVNMRKRYLAKHMQQPRQPAVKPQGETNDK